MRNNSVKLFWTWTSGTGGLQFKGISYLELWQPFCSAEWNHLCNSGRGYYVVQFCEIILNLGHRFRKRCGLKDFLSGTLAALLFGGAEPFMQFWKRASWETFMWSLIFGPVVQEMSFKEKVYRLMDGRQTKTNHNSSPWAFGSGELKISKWVIPKGYMFPCWFPCWSCSPE